MTKTRAGAPPKKTCTDGNVPRFGTVDVAEEVTNTSDWGSVLDGLAWQRGTVHNPPDPAMTVTTAEVSVDNQGAIGSSR
jgi:hypothetical protein